MLLTYIYNLCRDSVSSTQILLLKIEGHSTLSAGQNEALHRALSPFTPPRGPQVQYKPLVFPESRALPSLKPCLTQNNFKTFLRRGLAMEGTARHVLTEPCQV